MNYYEATPDGNLFVTPVVRSLTEVIFERELVAEYFKDNRVLSGVCDLFKTQVMLEKQGLVYSEFNTPLVFELQHSIDVYNLIKASDVIRHYEKGLAL